MHSFAAENILTVPARNESQAYYTIQTSRISSFWYV